MNLRDRAVIAVLSVLLVALVVATGLPGGPSGPVGALPSTDPLPPPVVYREGIVGQVSSVTPLTARSRAELALVGLVFSGLVRPGPGNTLQSDLAASWSVDETGLVWSIRIRDDARWHDGVAVTASDVVFTVRALRSTTVQGPGAASWAEVTAAATGPKTVTLTLESPIGGFLAALTQPLLPAHLLADVPLADLATHPFATEPVGTGPFALVDLDQRRAVLEPAARVAPPPPEDSSPPPSDSLATPRPAATPSRALPYLDGIEIWFFEDAAALVDAMSSAAIDGAAGLPARAALPLVGGDVRLVRYPTTTLSAAFLNLRPSHPELRDAAVRRALLGAVDRDALITEVLGGGALRADAMVPPASWVFDAQAAAPVPFDVPAAAQALTAAGWTKSDGVLVAPGATTPYALELLVVPEDVNPVAHAVAAGIADAWRALGFAVTVVDVPASDLAGRLREGTFTAALVDVAFGLEPDLFPLLASSQVRQPGTNLAGYQDPALDALLVAARKPGTTEERRAAWRALLAGLSAREPVLPLVWREEIVLQRSISGPLPRLLADPGDRFWDVLAWRLAADR